MVTEVRPISITVEQAEEAFWALILRADWLSSQGHDDEAEKRLMVVVRALLRVFPEIGNHRATARGGGVGERRPVGLDLRGIDELDRTDAAEG